MSTNKNNTHAMVENLEARNLFSVAFNAALDFDGDGKLTGDDMAIVDSGDVNLDGHVTGDDAAIIDSFGGLAALKVQFTSARALQLRAETDPYAAYDLDHDGFHTADDFSIADSGDFNLDGKVTGDDKAILDSLGGTARLYQKLGEAMTHDKVMVESFAFSDVDFNHDGVITDMDKAVAKTGDLNLDGIITCEDQNMVDACGGKNAIIKRLDKALVNKKFLDVDFDHDGQITADDYSIADSGDLDGDGKITADDKAISDSFGGVKKMYARLNKAMACTAKL